MNKIKLNNKERINVVIFAMLYFTWIISTMVLSSFSKQNNTVCELVNFIGSIITFAFVLLFHYPISNIISKNINDRIKYELAYIRRYYAIWCIYICIIGFFALSLTSVILFKEEVSAYKDNFWISLGVILGVVFIMFLVFTYKCINDTKTLIFVDKKQVLNMAIQQSI